MLKCYYVGDYNRNVNGGLEEQQLRNEIGVDFFYQTSTQMISKWQNITLVQKRVNIPTQINSQSWHRYFVIFWEALQLGAVMPQLRTFHMDLHPPTHVQLKYPIVNV